MNWRVGFIRLWAVLSVVWIVTIFLLMAPHQNYREVERESVSFKYEGKEITLSRSMDLLAVQNSVLAFVKRENDAPRVTPADYAKSMKDLYDYLDTFNTNELLDDLRASDERGSVARARAIATIIEYRTKNSALGETYIPSEIDLKPISPEEIARLIVYNYSAEDPYARTWRALESWRLFVLFGLGLPLAALLSSVVFVWVLSGFRSGHSLK